MKFQLLSGKNCAAGPTFDGNLLDFGIAISESLRHRTKGESAHSLESRKPRQRNAKRCILPALASSFVPVAQAAPSRKRAKH